MMLLAIQNISIGECPPPSHMHLSSKSASVRQPVYDNSNHVHIQNNCTIKHYWKSGP